MIAPIRWTIAIPTFNGSAFLESTLRSVLNQTDTDFELLVSDDGSRDDTLEIVRSVCGNRARIFSNESGHPSGLAGNWNRCVSEATGDWITILHQDDLLEPDFLEKHRRIADFHKTVGLIFGPVRLVNAEGSIVDTDSKPDFVWPDRFVVWPPGSLSRVLVKSNPIRCPGVSFRKDVHERLGGFDGSWKYVLDWDFWHRAGQVADIAIISECLASQRWHPASETQRLARGTVDLEENARLMRSILAQEPFSDIERPLIESLIRARMAQAWTNRAYQAACRGDRSLEWRAIRAAWNENPAVTARILSGSPRTLARLLIGRRGKPDDQGTTVEE